MSKGAASIDPAGHSLKKDPGWLRFVILSKTLVDRIKLLSFPRELFAVVQTLNWVQIY